MNAITFELIKNGKNPFSRIFCKYLTTQNAWVADNI